ncbi:MAG TPA: hypothetical protein VGX24_17685 [Pyrinomonadaceae bacterium]|jgi:CheY-like chemotaxis protein|nr:hypothetical protein [Pyrinomonadaceae bacterium]
MIEDSRETMIKFLHSLPRDENVEVQAIVIAPFFDNKIEQAIDEFDPDLIILDLLLTRDEESGFRVLRRLKESALLKDIPVVVCSKLISRGSDDKNRQRAELYNPAAVLPKIPFPEAQEFLNYARARS